MYHLTKEKSWVVVVHCCIVKFTSFQRDGRRCYEYLFACVKRDKMDSELLTCLLKFIEYFPDYLSVLSRTLLRFFGQPVSKQLFATHRHSNPSSTQDVCHMNLQSWPKLSGHFHFFFTSKQHNSFYPLPP